MLKKGVLRAIDANFNRCKEGLRVIEDIFRFIFEDNALRKKVRYLRHSLDCLIQEEIFKTTLLARDARKDIGKKFNHYEAKRENAVDILYINFQRIKESLRVLEEFSKLLIPNKASTVKKIRYEIYTLEKKTFQKRSSLCYPRHKNN